MLDVQTDSVNARPGIPPMFVLLAGILAVSTGSIFVRFAQKEAPSLVVACYRLGLATFILAPIVLAQKRNELRQLRWRQIGLLTLSGFFLSLHFASWITSLEYTSVVSSVVLVTTTPLWVAILATIFLKERISWQVGLGLVLALIGGLFVAGGQDCHIAEGHFYCPAYADFTQQTSFLGNSLALVGAICAGGYVLIGKKLRSSVSIITYTFLVYGTAFLFILLAVGLSGLSLFGFSRETYLWLAALAVFPQLIGHSSFNWALEYLSATYVSISLLGEPIGATVLAFMLLGEVPTLLEICGGVGILVGIYIASQTEKSV